MLPGFSIHREMQTMVAAGLTPYQVLLTGTKNPATYFGREGEFGTVEVGASADLILVDHNPLEDLGHLRNPAGVMMRGRWLSREVLEGQLVKIEQRYEEMGD